MRLTYETKGIRIRVTQMRSGSAKNREYSVETRSKRCWGEVGGDKKSWLCKGCRNYLSRSLTSALSPNNDIPHAGGLRRHREGGVEIKAIRRQEKENNRQLFESVSFE